MRKRNLLGQVFGRLTVIAAAPGRRKPGGTAVTCWRCRCECGNETEVPTDYLLSGDTKSCGCIRHGQTDTPTWTSWKAMHDRVRQQRPSYVAVTIDHRWDSFENFLADMGERPDGMTIDRIDNLGHYGPGNCRWATPAEQARNRRDNRYVTYQGKTQTITAWARELGIPVPTLHWRITTAGWPVDRAMTR